MACGLRHDYSLRFSKKLYPATITISITITVCWPPHEKVKHHAMAKAVEIAQKEKECLLVHNGKPIALNVFYLSSVFTVKNAVATFMTVVPYRYEQAFNASPCYFYILWYTILCWH